MSRLLPVERWQVYVVSCGRPDNVPAMTGLLAPDPLVWVVPEHEAADYQLMGASQVLAVPVPAGAQQLPVQRNAALADAAARGVACIQSDDDLRRFTDRGRQQVAWPMARRALLAAADQAPYAGLPPTPNPFFGKPGVTSWCVITAALTCTRDPAIEWDERLALKEDYDYTCQQLVAHGRVARTGDVLAAYRSGVGRGGANGYRTPEREAAVCAMLLARWPDHLRHNPRRPNELLLRPQKRS